MHVLVMAQTDPRSSGDHREEADRDGDDAPSEDCFRCVLRDVGLEGADDEEDEPCDTGGGASGVDTADVLQETSPEDAHPERGPLEQTVRKMLCVQYVKKVPFGRL